MLSLYTPTLCVSIMFMTSLNDVTIVCFLLLVGKALPMHRTGMLVHLCTHWYPCQLFPMAAHEPSHQFRILNFKPLTCIYIRVCSWSQHFPLQNEGQLEQSLWHSAQSDQVYMQTFSPKIDMMSLEHHLVIN